MDVSERIDTIINRTELNLTNMYHELLMVRHYLACYLLFAIYCLVNSDSQARVHNPLALWNAFVNVQLQYTR